MKKATQYVDEIVSAHRQALIMSDGKILSKKIMGILDEIVHDEVKELTKIRNAKQDSALIPIFKELRQKWRSICEQVSVAYPDFLEIKFFDEAIEELYPKYYKWYARHVLSLTLEP